MYRDCRHYNERQNLRRMCCPARWLWPSSPRQGNSGDSRTVLGIKGRAKPLSFDHKPQNEGNALPARPRHRRLLTEHSRKSENLRSWRVR